MRLTKPPVGSGKMLNISSSFIHRSMNRTYHPGSSQENNGAAGGWTVFPGWCKESQSTALKKVK